MFELNSTNEKSQEDRKALDIVNKMIANDRFSKWLGIEVLEVHKGYALLKMNIRNDMLNGFDIVHGGITYSLADSAIAFAANTYGKIAVSLEQSMSYPNPSKLGDKLNATATEVSRNNKTAVYDVIITNQNNEKVGIFRGTVYITSKEHNLINDEQINGKNS